jgi:hypothetical protein
MDFFFSSNLVLKELLFRVLQLVVNAFEEIFEAIRNQDEQKTKQILTQNQSLQTLFDLKFLFAFFDVKSDELSDKFKQVTGQYESLIDPFDFDICMPFIQSNITKSVIRTSVCIFFYSELSLLADIIYCLIYRVFMVCLI